MKSVPPQQQPLVDYLLEKAGCQVRSSSLLAEPMDDGGMGSMRFECAATAGGVAPSAAAECQFYDEDGVLVLATLLVGASGAPLELDVWKVDFECTKRFTSREELWT